MPELTKEEIMDALWDCDHAYNRVKEPGDQIDYIDATYNFDAFARAINKLIKEKTGA